MPSGPHGEYAARSQQQPASQSTFYPARAARARAPERPARRNVPPSIPRFLDASPHPLQHCSLQPARRDPLCLYMPKLRSPLVLPQHNAAPVGGPHSHDLSYPARAPVCYAVAQRASARRSAPAALDPVAAQPGQPASAPAPPAPRTHYSVSHSLVDRQPTRIRGRPRSRAILSPLVDSAASGHAASGRSRYRSSNALALWLWLWHAARCPLAGGHLARRARRSNWPGSGPQQDSARAGAAVIAGAESWAQPRSHGATASRPRAPRGSSLARSLGSTCSVVLTGIAGT